MYAVNAPPCRHEIHHRARGSYIFALHGNVKPRLRQLFLPVVRRVCATHQSVQCALFVLSLLDHLPILRQLRRKLFVTPTSINGHGWLGQWARIPTFSSRSYRPLAILTDRLAFTYASLWLVKPWARVLPISRPSLGKLCTRSNPLHLASWYSISWADITSKTSRKLKAHHMWCVSTYLYSIDSRR